MLQISIYLKLKYNSNHSHKKELIYQIIILFKIKNYIFKILYLNLIQKCKLIIEIIINNFYNQD